MTIQAEASKVTADPAGAPAVADRRRGGFARHVGTWVRPKLLPGSAAILSLGVGLGLWTFLSHGVVSHFILPTPLQVVDTFRSERGSLAHNTLLTLGRTAVSFAIGATAGLICAVLISWNAFISAIVDPVIQLFKPIPALVLAPFMVIWFGAGQGGVLSLAIWGCFFLVVVEAREALRNTPTIYQWAAATLGASSFRIHIRVMLPAAIPNLIGGLRVALIMTLNLVIIAEFNVADGGLGDIVIRGYRFLHPELLLFGVGVTVGMAILLDRCLLILRVVVGKWA